MSGPSVVTEQNRVLPERQADVFGDPPASPIIWALTSRKSNFLILITTAVGFYLGCGNEGRPFSINAAFQYSAWNILVASGTGTLNQVHRTGVRRADAADIRRPAAAGRLKPQASWSSGLLGRGGSVYLSAAVNGLASALAILDVVDLPVPVYPAKRETAIVRSRRCFSGAMPTLIGWPQHLAPIERRAHGPLYAILFCAVPAFYGDRIGCTAKITIEQATWFCPRANAEFFHDAGNVVATACSGPISMVQSPTQHAAIFYCAGACWISGSCTLVGFILQRSRLARTPPACGVYSYLPYVFATPRDTVQSGRLNSGHDRCLYG